MKNINHLDVFKTSILHLSYYKNNFYPENFSYFLWTSKQQITLRMIFLEHNSLKWDIFFNPIFIPCFSESMFFRVRVFQNPGFSGSSFFRVQVFLGPRFLGSRFFRVRVQGLGAVLEVAQYLALILQRHKKTSEFCLIYNIIEI